MPSKPITPAQRRQRWLERRFPILQEPDASNAFYFILLTKYGARRAVRRWGKSWRLSADTKLAHTFPEKTAVTGRTAGQKARHQRETVEKSVNVPLQVVWVRSPREQRIARQLLARLNKEHGVSA